MRPQFALGALRVCRVQQRHAILIMMSLVSLWHAWSMQVRQQRLKDFLDSERAVGEGTRTFSGGC